MLEVETVQNNIKMVLILIAFMLGVIKFEIQFI